MIFGDTRLCRSCSGTGMVKGGNMCGHCNGRGLETTTAAVSAAAPLGLWLDQQRPKADVAALVPVSRVARSISNTLWQGELFPKYLTWRKSQHGQTIYRLIELLIARMRVKRAHYGMFALINAARFEYDLNGATDDDGFKISNTFSPYLAREYTFSGTAPEGFFELIGETPEWFSDWARRSDRLLDV